MKVGKPKLVMSPNEWDSRFIETDVRFRSDEGNLVIEIFYRKSRYSTDGERDDFVDVKRELAFMGVMCFNVENVLGVNFLDKEFILSWGGDDIREISDDLIEFGKSEYIDMFNELWRKRAEIAPPLVKHYSIRFQDVEMSFNVISKGFKLSEEIFV